MQLKDSEKVAVGALHTVLQTWLAPELSGISERLGRIENGSTHTITDSMELSGGWMESNGSLLRWVIV